MEFGFLVASSLGRVLVGVCTFSSRVSIAVLVFFGILSFFTRGDQPQLRLVGARTMALGLYAVSAAVALVSRENKRIGDFAAGTVVVRDRSGETVTLAGVHLAPVVRDDGVTVEDRDLIARFLVRRDALEAPARATIASRIAGRVRPHLRASFDHLDDESLLEHLGRPDRV